MNLVIDIRAFMGVMFLDCAKAMHIFPVRSDKTGKKVFVRTLGTSTLIFCAIMHIFRHNVLVLIYKYLSITRKLDRESTI